MRSLLESLHDARFHLRSMQPTTQAVIGYNMLDEVIELLDKGYDIGDDADELVKKFGSVAAVPNKQSLYPTHVTSW